MDSFKCTQCDKAFSAEHSLKIHVGKMHQSKAEAKAAAKGGNGRKTRKTRKTRKLARVVQTGETTCRICGRSFGLPMHLARHITAKHGRGARAALARAGAPENQVDVTLLNIDQLLALKQTLDARLADIAQKMRRAKVAL